MRFLKKFNPSLRTAPISPSNPPSSFSGKTVIDPIPVSDSNKKTPFLSIIVPTWNEEGNINALAERVERSLSAASITYELIFIDDHSSDNTVQRIRQLEGSFPVRVYLKKGSRGKAYSLLEGFTHAQGNILLVLDADLQYPPEHIPTMIDQIKSGQADIVVANRLKQPDSIRHFLHEANLFIFGKLINGLTCDVQSGMKLFKREILERISLSPTAWTFDMEFLVKARDAGYRIGTIAIDFGVRTSGVSKVNLLKTSLEVGKAALKTKLGGPYIARLSAAAIEREGFGFHYKGRKFVSHTDLDETDSAVRQLTFNQVGTLLLFGLALIGAFLINWHATLVILVMLIIIYYFADLLFNLLLILRSFSHPTVQASATELATKRDWPAYTIFCPLYKEGDVLSQFVEAIRNLEYPKDKLQVMLLLEEDDTETIFKTGAMSLPDYIETVVVPHSLPKTKPKACNFGMTRATGEYVVIYDAEDIPDPLQLKKAVLAFEHLPAKVVCVQAKLNFYNSGQNLLTKVFTAEYSLWFDLILPGLQSLQAPIPLGGTSNHFKKAHLAELGNWDAFNVTEDCDLGIRLAKKGYQTAIFDSTTMEEANSSYTSWFWQRSRWIKGYIQSYLVHMRNPRDYIRQQGWLHFLAFQMVVGGKIGSLFINPFMWLITLLYFGFRTQFGSFIETFFPSFILYLGVFSLIFGNFLYLYYYMIGLVKRGKDEFVEYSYLVPFYWLAISVAAWLALYKFIRNPYQWSKTKHGLHLGRANATNLETPAMPTEAVTL